MLFYYKMKSHLFHHYRDICCCCFCHRNYSYRLSLYICNERKWKIYYFIIFWKNFSLSLPAEVILNVHHNHHRATLTEWLSECKWEKEWNWWQIGKSFEN
jgi:hypothetical protein